MEEVVVNRSKKVICRLLAIYMSSIVGCAILGALAGGRIIFLCISIIQLIAVESLCKELILELRNIGAVNYNNQRILYFDPYYKKSYVIEYTNIKSIECYKTTLYINLNEMIKPEGEPFHTPISILGYFLYARKNKIRDRIAIESLDVKVAETLQDQLNSMLNKQDVPV